MEIYLVRHTTPAIVKGVCYGQSDLDVADSFDQEAETIAKLVPDHVEAVYTSPLIRCSMLAQKIYPETKHITDARLKEIHFGDWEMKKWEEIDILELTPWMNDYVWTCPPNGETLNHLNNRVKAFMHDVLFLNLKTIVIFTHAGVIRCLLAEILEMPLSNIFKIGLGYASVSKLKVNRGVVNIEFVNLNGINLTYS